MSLSRSTSSVLRVSEIFVRICDSRASPERVYHNTRVWSSYQEFVTYDWCDIVNPTCLLMQNTMHTDGIRDFMFLSLASPLRLGFIELEYDYNRVMARCKREKTEAETLKAIKL